jgi:hypothetical protein
MEGPYHDWIRLIVVRSVVDATNTTKIGKFPFFVQTVVISYTLGRTFVIIRLLDPGFKNGYVYLGLVDILQLSKVIPVQSHGLLLSQSNHTVPAVSNGGYFFITRLVLTGAVHISVGQDNALGQGDGNSC